MQWVGFAGGAAIHAMFPLSMSGRFLGILVGMDQKDSFLMLMLRSSPPSIVASFLLVLLVTVFRAVFLLFRQVHHARRHGRHGSEGHWWPRSSPTAAVACFLLVLLVDAVALCSLRCRQARRQVQVWVRTILLVSHVSLVLP